jgi:hypothetical protein
MTALVWSEAPIAKLHDRAAFDCGDADLNLYLRKFARQNHDSGGAKCFVAAPTEAPARVLGFYTLSPASLDYARTPALSTLAHLEALIARGRASRGEGPPLGAVYERG